MLFKPACTHLPRSRTAPTPLPAARDSTTALRRSRIRRRVVIPACGDGYCSKSPSRVRLSPTLELASFRDRAGATKEGSYGTRDIADAAVLNPSLNLSPAANTTCGPPLALRSRRACRRRFGGDARQVPPGCSHIPPAVEPLMHQCRLTIETAQPRSRGACLRN